MIVQSKHLHIMHSWRPSWSPFFNLQCNIVLFRLPVSNILLYLHFVFSNAVVWFSLVFENLIQQQKDHNLNFFHFYVCFFLCFFSTSKLKRWPELCNESGPPLVSTLSVMATTEEVTVSMGEVMVVKSKDEGDGCDDADKTQVILQLQPIAVGYVRMLSRNGKTQCMN